MRHYLRSSKRCAGQRRTIIVVCCVSWGSFIVACGSSSEIPKPDHYGTFVFCNGQFTELKGYANQREIPEDRVDQFVHSSIHSPQFIVHTPNVVDPETYQYAEGEYGPGRPG